MEATKSAPSALSQQPPVLENKKLKALKERWVQRKDFKFFQCPSCHAVLRVPSGRGKIKIVCRKCGNTFIGKS